MNNRHVQIVLMSCVTMLWGCGGGSNPDAESGPSDTVQQVGPYLPDAPVLKQDGRYVVAAERKIEVLPQQVNVGNSLPYPERTGFEIKSLNTDFWPNRGELLNANTSGVITNLLWSNWQPTFETNCSNAQINFEGQCFTVELAFDHQIRYWSNQGKNITAVLYGVPGWARNSDDCTAVTPDVEKFCAARDPNDYARFAAMIAERYNGLNGNGRVVDFIIHNEVNMNQWYKVGCGAGIPCDQEAWISDYAANYNAAYDRIKAVQPDARVLMSFAHQFDTSFDSPATSNPILSVKTFIRGVHSRAEGRKWRIAYHPYNHHLSSAESSFDDLPRVTFGNIGVITGWLRQEFPSQPESWEVHLTENGISSNGQSDEYSQDVAVCNSYRNVLGTPDIENYIYHRMQDNNYEAVRGAALGLRREDGTAKLVWDTWAFMSGRDGQRNNLNCGFENLPYTKLSSFANSNGDYRASTRVVGDSYSEVNSWYLQRNYSPGTYMAYECKAAGSSYISTDVNCGGELSYGPVGYVHEAEGADRVALFTCFNDTQVLMSDEYDCGGDEVVEFIGYVNKQR